MLDREGFRPNVGIILLNSRNQVFWGKRLRTHSWQFPQGGIMHGESPEQAMYRELHEEVGLRPEHLRLSGEGALAVPGEIVVAELLGGEGQQGLLVGVGRVVDIDVRVGVRRESVVGTVGAKGRLVDRGECGLRQGCATDWADSCSGRGLS